MNWKHILFPVDNGKLSKKEKIIYMLIFGIIPIIFSLSLLLIIAYEFNRDVLESILLFSPFILMYLAIVSPVVFHNTIVKKVEYHSEYGLGNTYQYITVLILFYLPGLVSGGIVVGYVFNNIILGVGISLAFTTSILGQFLRRNIFNDNSRNLNGKEVIGYEPGRLGLLNVIIGLYGYVSGFRSSGIGALIWLCVIFAFQLILLFPDKINKNFPLEIRTKKGHFAFLGSVAVLFLVFVFMCHGILLGTGVKIGHLNFKNIIQWIISVIVAIILLKKYSDIWK